MLVFHDPSWSRILNGGCTSGLIWGVWARHVKCRDLIPSYAMHGHIQLNSGRVNVRQQLSRLRDRQGQGPYAHGLFFAMTFQIQLDCGIKVRSIKARLSKTVCRNSRGATKDPISSAQPDQSYRLQWTALESRHHQM